MDHTGWSEKKEGKIVKVFSKKGNSVGKFNPDARVAKPRPQNGFAATAGDRALVADPRLRNKRPDEEPCKGQWGVARGHYSGFGR